jgi:photosystem II stability/assembly factor-like uncharacterized protein
MKFSLRNCLLILVLLLFTSTILPQDNPNLFIRHTDSAFIKNPNSADKEKLFPHKSVSSGTGIWTELNPGVPRVTYTSIHFVNKDTGWAVGDLGAVIKTTNGGQDWSTIQTNTLKPLLRVRSYNGHVVIATGNDGTILRSVDGGENFNPVPSGLGTDFDIWGLELVNDTLGWACGNTALLKTTDSGETWQIVNTPGYMGYLWYVVRFLSWRW